MNHQESARLTARHGEPVVLEGVRADGDLRGAVLEMSVEQRFRNPGDTNLEVVYSFPLPWGAVLLGVEVLLGGKRLEGAVVEKKQSEARYEEALSQGDAAILLERNHDHGYSLNLGNLAAKEACVVTLRYAQLLAFEQRSLRVMIPTVIAPRYGDAVAQGGLQPHQAPTNDLRVQYPFDIELRLHGELAQARVATPSHPSSMSVKDGVLTVALARRGALDRDFVLVVDQLAHTAFGMQAADIGEPGRIAALLSFCPRIEAALPSRVSAKLLVDCSGSMEGDSINAARRALQAIVLQMGEGDRFSLSAFGSAVAHRSRGLWSSTDATRLAAQRWVGALKADMGGTEMESALSSTFALTPSGGADVLLVTDGEIFAIDATIEAARVSGHRLFVVGVGSSPAESHLRRLAEATGGACDFVAAGEAVEPAVLRMFARLRSPRLEQVRVVWPEGIEPAWASPVGASVFGADTVHVQAFLPRALKGTVRLQGARAGQREFEDIGSVTFGEALLDAPLWSRMAASARVKPMDAHDAIALAVRYQLVTPATNFLLVHVREASEKAPDMPALHQVAQMVPAGWGGTGSVDFESMAGGASLDVYASMAPVMAAPAGAAPMDMAAPRTRSLAGMFLRKSAAAPDAKKHKRGSPSKEAADLTTPAGLQAWTLANPASSWPRSYKALVALGVGGEVCDWVELVMGASGSEAQVVEAFLQAMHDLRFDAKTGAPDQVSPRVAQFIDALHGITAERWPDAVYALAP